MNFLVKGICEGSRGLLPARVVIPLSSEYSPRSKLLLSPPGGGGGDGGGCRIPALSPAASGRGGAEAGASELHAPPRSRRAPGRPARLARSRLSPLRSRGIVFPRPPPPPPPGLGHATFSRLRPPRPPPPLLLCLPLSASATPTSPERRSASGEGGGTRTCSGGVPRRRRTLGGVWRARQARLGRPGVRCAEPGAGRCAARGSQSAAPAPRGSGGCSDLTAAGIRRGPANVGAAAPTPTLLTPPGDVYNTAAGTEPPPRRCLTPGTEVQRRTPRRSSSAPGAEIAATRYPSACSSAAKMEDAKLASDGDRFRTYN
ncbi:uncharacterized protein LOC111737893 [Pteropus vampyrus]|uniref:Uncharacterized protein LOC111737893 n=1 Tax=Pteropus vampyrus TaxID=132908 RepID=A0A6P6CB54_PTEVA|nr:uncharacterized protein LOC111737893 [Pteropus vampyrus]